LTDTALETAYDALKNKLLTDTQQLSGCSLGEVNCGTTWVQAIETYFSDTDTLENICSSSGFVPSLGNCASPTGPLQCTLNAIFSRLFQNYADVQLCLCSASGGYFDFSVFDDDDTAPSAPSAPSPGAPSVPSAPSAPSSPGAPTVTETPPNATDLERYGITNPKIITCLQNFDSIMNSIQRDLNTAFQNPAGLFGCNQKLLQGCMSNLQAVVENGGNICQAKAPTCDLASVGLPNPTFKKIVTASGAPPDLMLQCTSFGDPNVVNFNGSYFRHSQAGIFTMWQVGDFRLQVTHTNLSLLPDTMYTSVVEIIKDDPFVSIKMDKTGFYAKDDATKNYIMLTASKNVSLPVTDVTFKFGYSYDLSTNSFSFKESVSNSRINVKSVSFGTVKMLNVIVNIKSSIVRAAAPAFV
jgi:hypothetical protein